MNIVIGFHATNFFGLNNGLNFVPCQLKVCLHETSTYSCPWRHHHCFTLRQSDGTFGEEISLKPILSVKVNITIDTIINFENDLDGYMHVDVIRS